MPCDPPATSPPSPKPAPRRLRRWLFALAAFLLLSAIGLELFARYSLGLGDPPLMVAHPTIEYLFKPGTYHRFDHIIHYNAHHMRSPDGDAFPVLVIGDSVINGGAQTRDEDLATSILAQRLGVPVGNASAGSWGPPNLLAYTDAFGFFGAKVVVLVLSSHDAGDVPDFKPIVGVSPNFPGQSPPFALWEAATRYLPRYLPSFGLSAPGTPPGDPMGLDQPQPAALDALATLIDRAKAAGAAVIVVQHLERDEPQDHPKPGHTEIAGIAQAHGAEVIALDLPDSAYRDGIHPNSNGHRTLAETLEPVLHRALADSTATEPHARADP